MPVDQVSIAATADHADLSAIRHLLVASAIAVAVPVDAAVLELVVGEILANAVHQSSLTTVRASGSPGKDRLRVEVTNPGVAEPLPRSPDPSDSSGGRGLRIVEGLSSSWGSFTRGGCTTVWFELAAVPAPTRAVPSPPAPARSSPPA